MLQDNQWHEGVCVKTPDGTFEIFESIQDIKENWNREIPKESMGYMPIKYNWNKGQPIVDFGDFKASIVDLENEHNFKINHAN